MSTATITVEFSSRLLAMIDQLRARDHDPAFSDAPTCDAYARISINRLTGDLEKTDRQLGDILHAMESRHVRLGEILRDDNSSAWKPNGKRPQFRILMQRVESGQSQAVAVWRTDRLLRQPRDLEALIDAADKGTTIFATSGEFNLDRSSDRTFLRIQVAMACQESDNNSERSKRKQAAMRAEGKRHSGPRPWGEAGMERGEQAPAATVERERAAIRYAVERFIAGDTLRSIARSWTEDFGLTTRGYGKGPAGAAMTGTDVRMVLTRPGIAGILTRGRGKSLRRTGMRTDADPIVSVEDFDRVQSLFDARTRTGRPLTTRSAMSGHLFCGRCGKALALKRNPRGEGKVSLQYVCSGAQRGSCGRLGIAAEAVEDFAAQAVAGFLSSPEYAARVATHDTRLGEAQRALAQAETDRDDLARRAATRAISRTEWDILRGPLAAAVTAAQETCQRLVWSQPASNPEATLAASHADLLTQWAAADPAGRRALVERARLRFTIAPATGSHQPAVERIAIEPL
jgi:DNA invertase Pin-like site-specific DNA recombinase